MPVSTTKLDLQQFYPDELEIVSVEEKTSEIHISMHSRSRFYHCPKCGMESNQLHATHHRTVQDLPILGKRVILDINIHEFLCTNSACNCGAISETFNGFLNYYSRMTERLVDFVTVLALETSCESSARIMQAMNIKISGDTVIRTLIKRYSKQEVPDCSCTIGVDDFAFKKRHTYGTVIVDAATHQPVAVLEGRDGTALKEWLKENKHVTTVTRDRASVYAKAVEEILPDCMQIADRFHLHQNLMDAVNKILGREVPATNAIAVDIDQSDESTKDELSTSAAETGKKNRSHCG